MYLTIASRKVDLKSGHPDFKILCKWLEHYFAITSPLLQFVQAEDKLTECENLGARNVIVIAAPSVVCE